MFPSAGQPGEDEGGACPQCGLFNGAEAFYCRNCRYPLHAERLAAVKNDPSANGKLRSAASDVPTRPVPPPVIEQSRQRTVPRSRRAPVPWVLVGLSWGLLGLAYVLGDYAFRSGALTYHVLAFFLAMLAVGAGSALLRERSWLARVSGGLVILVYVILQVIAVRALLQII